VPALASTLDEMVRAVTEEQLYELVEEFEEAAMWYGKVLYSTTTWSDLVAHRRKESLDTKTRLKAAIAEIYGHLHSAVSGGTVSESDWSDCGGIGND
jgi:hypothetical protein